MYIYFSYNFFNISPFKKITSFTGFGVIYFYLVLCFLFSLLIFLFFFSFTQKTPRPLISLRGRFLHSSNLKSKYSNIQISYLSSLFYYIFCYLSHERKLNARRRGDSMERKSDSFTNYFNNLLFEKLSVCFFLSFLSQFFSYTSRSPQTITNFRVVFFFFLFSPRRYLFCVLSNTGPRWISSVSFSSLYEYILKA